MSVFIIFFFFNNTATPEISPLPYTTLFRSPRSACTSTARPPANRTVSPSTRPPLVRWNGRVARTTPSTRRKSGVVRSEEHTSELQSRQYLVCRLLLEKKKKKKIFTLNNTKV